MGMRPLKKQELIDVIKAAPEGITFDFKVQEPWEEYAGTIQFRAIVDPSDPAQYKYLKTMQKVGLITALKSILSE